MKNLLLTLLSIVLLSFTSDNNEYFATVEKVSDVPIFIFSKPSSEYEVVGKAMSFNDMIKMATDEKSTVRQKAEKIVETARKRVEDEKISNFDALIIELDKDKVRAIKFKSDVSTNAKVDNYDNNIAIFFFCEPNEEYEIVEQLKANYSPKAERNGILFDKIRSMIDRTIKKQKDGKIKSFDAIIISPDDLSEKLIIF